MSCSIKAYLYIFPVNAGDVVGSSRSAVNPKQCSKRGLNYQDEYGLVFVIMFVTLRKNSASCRGNVDATKMNMYLSVLSAFAEKSLDVISHSTRLSFSCSMHSTPVSSTPLCRPSIFFEVFHCSITFRHLFENRLHRVLQFQEIAFFICLTKPNNALHLTQWRI